MVVAFLQQITIVINSVNVVLVALRLGWAYVTRGCPSENTTAFWIMTFPPSLNKHRKLSLPLGPVLACHLVPGLATSAFT